MKKLCVIAVSATVAVSAGVLAYNEIKADDLFSANVEALADNEAGGRAICYSQYSHNDSMRCLECGSCVYVNGAGVDKGGYCRW